MRPRNACRDGGVARTISSPLQLCGPSAHDSFYPALRLDAVRRSSTLSSAAGGPFSGGWAILHIAVTPIDIDVGYALIAAANRAGTGMPFPWCPRSVPLGRITRVEVRVDIGLCIRRHHPDG